MIFTTALLALLPITLVAATPAPAFVTYDNTYDNPNGSLNNVACSNGENGLVTKGYTTFSSLPSFPFIGGVPGAHWNSPVCGTCWALTYNGTTINVLAIDNSGNFNVAQEAMDALTDNQAVQFGRVAIQATQVAGSNCGM